MNGEPVDDQEHEVECLHCGRKLDECAFCDETGCGAAICFECVVSDLGQSLPQPHKHGG